MKEKVKYILGGQSFMTEGTVPREWSYMDGTYVKSVNNIFGKLLLKTYPNATIYQLIYYTFIKRIKQIPLLNYVKYDKKEARKVVEKELGWTYYGGHHYENVYTKFASGWYLYHKFNIDKRKVSLSGPVRMGSMSPEEAREELKKEPTVSNAVVDHCVKKLGLSQQEFNEIMDLPPKTFHDYHTSYTVLKKFRGFVKLAVKLGILTPVLYEKYLG